MKPHHRPRHGMSSYLAYLLLLLLPVSELAAQVTNFPMDYQLYPRNLTTNQATVRIAGTVAQSTGYRQMRVYLYRDGNYVSTTNFTLQFRNNSASYSFDINIPAERNNYRFSLYGVSNSRETLIRTANNVVAGDAFIIQGQSNAVANQRGSTNTANNADDPSNAPNRNFVRVYGSGHTSMNYTKAWFIAKGNVWYDVDGQVGQWGMRLGSNLVGATNVPVAIINGGMPGEPLSYFQRNDANPRAANTNYGRLLRRIEEAGLKNNIRALIWYQGESDNQGVLNNTQMSTQQYKNLFNNLYNDWKQDYPGLNRFYIMQIRHGCGIISPDNTLKIQEAQRQLDKESGEILTLSTSNTNQISESGLGFCHYNFVNGYRNVGDWLSSVIRRDLYNHNMPSSIESPEPVSAQFTQISGSGVATQVSITLKDQQSAFTLSGDLRNDFRLDGGNYTIQSVTLSGATIRINFSRGNGTNNNPTSVSYRNHQGTAAPIITNNQGLGLINFEYFPISGSTPPPSDPPPPTGTVCQDTYEPNNSITTGKALPHNTTIQGSISSATDEDWFNIRIWNYPYFRIRLTNVTADYDLYLYSTSGQLIRSVTTSGAVNETIIYNDGLPDANYRLKVVGKNGANDPNRCYSLLLEAFSSPLANPTPPPTQNPQPATQNDPPGDPTNPPPPDGGTTNPPPGEDPTPPPPPAGDPCPDSFEPNNTITTAKSLAHNTNTNASIASATDEDWYTFRTWDFRYFKISLWNLAADYDLYLYDVNGNLLASSTNSGTASEVINYNNGPANTNYRIRVVSKSGAFDPTICYRIRGEAFSAPLNSNSPAYSNSTNQSISIPTETIPIQEITKNQLQVYPNPASNYTIIDFHADKAAKTEFELVDMAGRTWMVERSSLPAGPIQYRLNLPQLSKGTYILRIKREYIIINRKLTVVNQ